MRLALVLAAVCVARVAHADLMLASTGDNTLRVHRIANDKVTKVYEETNALASRWGFSDEHTLWVLRQRVTNGKSAWSVNKVVDGKAEPEHVISDADFKLQGLASRGADPTLEIGMHGVVWIAQCFYKSPAQGEPCVKSYLRLDGATVVAAKQPPGTVRVHVGHVLAALASPPKGFSTTTYDHSVKWGKYRGVKCVGPKGRLKWEKPNDTAKKVEWIKASPAIVRITYNDPMGEGSLTALGDDLGGDLGGDDEVAFIENCKRELAVVAPLSDEIWISSADGKAFTAWRGAKQIGSFTAGRYFVVWP